MHADTRKKTLIHLSWPTSKDSAKGTRGITQILILIQGRHSNAQTDGFFRSQLNTSPHQPLFHRRNFPRELKDLWRTSWFNHRKPQYTFYWRGISGLCSKDSAQSHPFISADANLSFRSWNTLQQQRWGEMALQLGADLQVILTFMWRRKCNNVTVWNAQLHHSSAQTQRWQRC